MRFYNVLPFIDDTTLIIVSIIFGVFFIFGFTAFVIFLVSNYKNKRRLKEINDLKTTTRVFIIDIKNDQVKYFDRVRLHVLKTCSLVQFYNKFASRDRLALIEWVGDIINPKAKAKPYLELSVIDTTNQRLTYSILQLQKVDYENQVLHLESFLLRIKNTFEPKKKPYIRFSTSEAYSKAILASHSKKGVTICLDLFHKNPDQRNNPIPHLVFAQVRNHLLNYVLPSRPILIHNDHQIIISDLKITSKSQVLRFLTELRINISRILMLTSNFNDIDFVFAIVNNRLFPRNPEKLISISSTTAELLRDGNQKICYYTPELALELNTDNDMYRSEVERIVHDNRISFKYRPVYNTNSRRIIGYEALISPDDSTMFESLQALKNYAIKTGDDRELFSSITRKSISRFIQEKDGVSLRIFYPTSYKERMYVVRTLSYIPKIKETHIVIVFDEREIINLVSDDVKDVLETIRTFKLKGYDVALTFTNYDLPFSREFYSSFDYFIIDCSESLTIKTSNEKLSNFYAFAEKLVHLRKTIIASNIANWDNVELMIRLGLPIISSNAISEPSEMILPIPQKSIKKIQRVLDTQGVKYGK